LVFVFYQKAVWLSGIKAVRFLLAFDFLHKKLEDGEITVDEYEDWKARYNPSVFMGDDMEDAPDPYTGQLNSKMRP
jgi:hypothetical protein